MTIIIVNIMGTISVSLSDDVEEKIRKLASFQKRSLSKQVEMIIEQAYEELDIDG